MSNRATVVLLIILHVLLLQQEDFFGQVIVRQTKLMKVQVYAQQAIWHKNQV